MKRWLIWSVLAALILAPRGVTYVEAPHTLGRVVNESTHIVLVEVTMVNKEKNLIYFKKVRDLKGKHPTDVIKHNIGKGGFHPREWQYTMEWAEVGKQAVFFHNGGASETCIGTYWYQAYAQGEWWGMSHAEPFLLRSYYGEVAPLVDAVEKILKNEEVVVTCLADGDKTQMQLRKGKVQRVKAGLKRIDYNVKRDFVAFGADGEIDEFKTIPLLAESSEGWKFLPAAGVKGDDWKQPAFDDAAWRTGKAPIGYGEEEIAKRKGTTVPEQGQNFVFRKSFDLPMGVLDQKGSTIRLCVASDNSAEVYINGQLADNDPVPDHEPIYWNQDIEVPAKLLKPGKNVIAVLVRNAEKSSDLFLDVELSVQVPLPKKPKK